jgi:hypothetical protein
VTMMDRPRERQRAVTAFAGEEHGAAIFWHSAQRQRRRCCKRAPGVVVEAGAVVTVHPEALGEETPGTRKCDASREEQGQ